MGQSASPERHTDANVGDAALPLGASVISSTISAERDNETYYSARRYKTCEIYELPKDADDGALLAAIDTRAITKELAQIEASKKKNLEATNSAQEGTVVVPTISRHPSRPTSNATERPKYGLPVKATNGQVRSVIREIQLADLRTTCGLGKDAPEEQIRAKIIEVNRKIASAASSVEPQQTSVRELRPPEAGDLNYRDPNNPKVKPTLTRATFGKLGLR